MSAQPLSYTSAGYREPFAAEGVNVGEIHTGLILRQALPVTHGGRRTRRRSRGRSKKIRRTRHKSRGGFHPSIMGGVVQNAPLLAPIALRQAMNLFAKYRKGSARTRPSRTRKTRNRRNSGRRA